ncbi:MAG: GGDEF domain-containing protein [Gammaproteobacteria bacterium]|nr:GGDEF domain-containing protein [Gammaproteobacteria bacterium]
MNVESLRRLLSKYSSNTIILVSGLVLHIGMLFCAGWFILPVWSLLSMPFIAIVVFLWLGVFVVLTVFFINSYDCREQIDWQSLAELDPLTEISNRRGLFNKINASFQRALYSVVVIDIDDFKCINDTYGHNVGDDVLRYLASLLDNMIRHDDIVCRWGGG